MLTHWKSNAPVDMALHADTVFWFRVFGLTWPGNQDVERTQYPDFESLVWPDRGIKTLSGHSILISRVFGLTWPGNQDVGIDLWKGVKARQSIESQMLLEKCLLTNCCTLRAFWMLYSITKKRNTLWTSITHCIFDPPENLRTLRKDNPYRINLYCYTAGFHLRLMGWPTLSSSNCKLLLFVFVQIIPWLNNWIKIVLRLNKSTYDVWRWTYRTDGDLGFEQ